MSMKLNDSRRILVILLPVFLAAAFLTSLRLVNCGGRGALFLSACLTLFIGLFLLFIGDSLGRFLLPVALITCLLVIMRLWFFDTSTSDYVDFLKPWTEQFRETGGLSGLKYIIGNYNIPYLFFISIFSYFSFDTLYLIKLVSVFFDLLLAFCLMKTVSVFTSSPLRKAGCLVLALALPTVVINGSIWGQCDSIYVSFAVMSLWLCLDRKPGLSMAAAALSFAFKLQAVFLLPVFLLFLFDGRLKWYHLPIFPAVYVLAVSPAIIAGRGFLDTLLIYVATADSAGGALNYNSPSMYSLPCFWNPSDQSAAAKAGILSALLLCLIVFTIFFIRRKEINNRSLFFAGLLFAVSIPILLPHMHDRYFYLCDVLILAAACFEPVCIIPVFFSQFASLLGYHAYFYMRYLLPMRYGFALLAVLAVIAAFFTVDPLFSVGRAHNRY